MIQQPEGETTTTLTSRQRRIVELLSGIHEDLARMYLGALWACADARNPDSLYQAAHSLRELANNLPRYLGIIPSKRFDIWSQVDRLLCDWGTMTTESESTIGNLGQTIPVDNGDIQMEMSETEIPVPANLYSKLSEFFKDYESSRLTHRKRVRMLLDSLEPAEVVDKTHILEPVIKHWIEVTEWFVGVCHHAEVEREEFDRKLELFESGLFAMLSPFYAPIEEIDTLLQMEEPTTSDVERAQSLLKKREHVKYFFENLPHAGWIKPLIKLGYFKDPPEPVVADGYTRYPSWPESRYLKKVAADVPDEIIDIIATIPETENARVHNDLMEALLAMPANISAKVIGSVKGWVKNKSPILLPENFGKLIANLASEGEVDSALGLSDEVLEPTLELPPQYRDKKPYISLMSPMVVAYFDDWFYSKILREYYPTLVRAEPKRAFKLLCQKLRHSIHLELGKDRAGEHDASYLWRRAIEPHAQSRGTDHIKNALVSALRDAGEEILRTKGEDGEEYLDILLSFELPVFRRLELHLLRSSAKWFASRIAKRLEDRNLFEDVRCHHEYFLLLSEQFGSLPSEVQENILEWVEEGPQTEKYEKSVQKMIGRPPSKQEIESFVKKWQLEKLCPISNYLPETWKNYYDELIAEYGKPRHPDFLIYAETQAGPRSPLSEEDLQAKTPIEVLEFIREWEPSRDFLAPSREGLGRVLRLAISKNPKQYLEIADEFKKDVAPTYVSAFLSALREACKNMVVFRWESALDLCAWVTDQPRDQRYPQAQEDEDTDWVTSRRAVADLLVEGFSTQDSTIPFTLRGIIWPILATLVEDPDPTPEYEKKYGGRNMDPVNLCVNSIRGQAMHAAIRYALWVVSSSREESEFKKKSEPLLSMVPEVRELLDSRLNPEVEPSPAVHSVYGEYFPYLFRLDRDWVVKNVSRIFPREESFQDRRDAAWRAYVRYCLVYNEVALALEDEYRREIERLGQRELDEDVWNFGRSLAEHVMIGYWRDLFPLDDKSLISEFFKEGKPDIRANAIFFVGISLQQTKKGDAPEEVLERLKKLWSVRLEAAKASQDLENFEKELASFGPWSASSHFDTSFSLKQLYETLSLTSGRIRMSDRLVEYLALTGNEFPLETVECLDLMLRGDDEIFAMLTYKEETKNILEIALASGNTKAREIASNLVNYAGGRGFHGFRNLLST